LEKEHVSALVVS